jgi:hypothetical protein
MFSCHSECKCEFKHSEVLNERRTLGL